MNLNACFFWHILYTYFLLNLCKIPHWEFCRSQIGSLILDTEDQRWNLLNQKQNTSFLVGRCLTPQT